MKSELQAVILAAGKGTRMTELTNNLPKCLLPIANKPMIYYPLTMLIEADFKDVIIVIPDLYENEIKSQLSNYKINMEFVTIPFEQDLGTADSLKLIHKKITSDLLVLSCDFISNYPLMNFINFYRIHDASLSTLIANESLVPNQGQVPGRKTKFKTDKDIIGIDSQNPDRIVFLNSEVDFEEFINFKLSMIKLCPNMNLFTKYFDGHVYILKQYLIDYLVNEKTNFSSLKGEFVPFLIKSQFKKLTANDQFNPYKIEANTSFILNKDGDTKKSVHSYIFVDELKKELDRFDPLIGDDLKRECETANYPDSLLRCSPVVIDSQKYFISRANNLLSYYEINKLSRTLFPDHKNADFGRAQISADCIIGENNQINERTSIKKTIIGNNCTISEKVRIENCLIMNNVIIEELCLLKNSIICNNVRIAQKSNLSDCVVASNEQIDQSSTLINESIVHTDQMMEFE